MKSAKNIERLISKINVTPASRSDEKLNEIMAAQEESKTKPAASEPNIWRIIMTSKTTRFAIAAVIIVAVLFGMNQFGGSIDGANVALADVIENMKKMPWIHGTVTINQSGKKITQEHWKCFNPSIDASIDGDGSITYYDYSKKKMYQYNPDSNTIRISPKTDEYNLPGPGSPVEMIPAFLEKARKENAEIIRKLSDLDGISVEVIRIVSKAQDCTIVCDIERNLMLTMATEAVIPVTDEKVTAEVTFDYPDDGPQDIYALGVPEDAAIIDTVPKGNMKDLTDELQRRFDDGIGDHTAVILDSSVDEDGLLKPSEIIIMRQKGKLKRYDHYYAFDASRRKNFVTLYQEVKNKWPDFTIAEIEELVKAEALDRQMFFDGKQTYLRGKEQKQQIRTDLFKTSPSDCIAGIIWVNPQVVMLGNADTDEVLEPLSADADHAGLMGFRVIRTVSNTKDGGRYKPSPGTDDYWFDPEKDFMLVERVTENKTGQYGGIAFYQTTVEEAAKTSDGKWYPAVIREEYIRISPKGKRSNSIAMKKILIDIDKTPDQNLFDSESLIK